MLVKGLPLTSEEVAAMAAGAAPWGAWQLTGLVGAVVATRAPETKAKRHVGAAEAASGGVR